ncbi:MAG: hypothetical protein ACTSPB_00255 [Candidatus Thorarchaeota archaeon]
MGEVTFEEVEEFFAFLQGGKMKGFKFSEKSPEIKLSPEQAFKIIYVLQEGLGVIPDNYEKCSMCHSLYDSDCEGDHTERMSEWYIEVYGEDCGAYVPTKICDSVRDSIEFKFFCGGCLPSYEEGIKKLVISLLKKALEGEDDE